MLLSRNRQPSLSGSIETILPPALATNRSINARRVREQPTADLLNRGVLSAGRGGCGGKARSPGNRETGNSQAVG